MYSNQFSMTWWKCGLFFYSTHSTPLSTNHKNILIKYIFAVVAAEYVNTRYVPYKIILKSKWEFLWFFVVSIFQASIKACMMYVCLVELWVREVWELEGFVEV